jgi:hypothetical protein
VDKGQFSYGDPNDKNFGPGEPGYTIGTGENARVSFDPGVNTPSYFRSGLPGIANHFATVFKLSLAQAFGLAVLHELSHATGKTVHPGNKLPSGTTEVKTQNQLNQEIYDNCFKPDQSEK